MEIKELLFRELVKRGYSKEGEKKIWEMSDLDFLFLTDELAKGFLELRAHPRYQQIIINKEFELIDSNLNFFNDKLGGESFNLVDVSCGDGIKAKFFLERLSEDSKVRFCPISPSKYLLDMSIDNIKNSGLKNVVDFKSVVSATDSVDEVISELRNRDFQKNVVFLLGSLISSYEINDYLFKISQSMLPGDSLIIGNGIRKGERFVNIDSYKSAVFSKWMIKLMRELGFEDSEVEYDARFANNRVEGFFVIKKDKVISFGDDEIEFKNGDEIVTNVSYKYYSEEFKKFCEMYFSRVNLFIDSEYEYVLVYCEK